MKLIEAVTRTIAENRMMSPGYIAAQVMETVQRFVDHNIDMRLNDSGAVQIKQMIEEDHMP
jgi:hypothetical protein